MSILAYVLRVISLSFLFGGSASIVFAAITLVKAAQAAGVPLTDAAAANAPMFYMYSTVVLVCSLALFTGEALDFVKQRKTKDFKLSNLTNARYISSLLCIVACLVFTAAIVPQMKQLAPLIKKDETAHAAFVKLHSMSRIDFSIVIVCSLVSLLLPGFESKPAAIKTQAETPVASA
jgi:hypothetical protein